MVVVHGILGWVGRGMLSIFFLRLELGTGFAFDMIVGAVTSP